MPCAEEDEAEEREVEAWSASRSRPALEASAASSLLSTSFSDLNSSDSGKVPPLGGAEPGSPLPGRRRLFCLRSAGPEASRARVGCEGAE